MKEIKFLQKYVQFGLIADLKIGFCVRVFRRVGFCGFFIGYPGR